MKNPEIKKYWNDIKTESMYDKNLLECEIQSILILLRKNDRVLDVGCGEGEGSVRYIEKVKELMALDFSQTRLEKLKERNNRLKTLLIDMREISPKTLGGRFNKVITQRALINLESFQDQKKTILGIHSLLEKGGNYIMLEGFNEGSKNINKVRNDFKLPPIEVKWYNHFFDRGKLLAFMAPYFDLVSSRDFSVYFFITRVFNAILKYPDIPRWSDPVNDLAKELDVKYGNEFIKGISRLELLVFKKK